MNWLFVLVSDPLELNLPDVSTKINVSVTDGKSRQQLTLGDIKTAQAYHEKAEKFIADNESMLSKAGARLIHICAGRSLEQQLKNGVVPWIR